MDNPHLTHLVSGLEWTCERPGVWRTQVWRHDAWSLRFDGEEWVLEGPASPERVGRTLLDAMVEAAALFSPCA